MRYWLAVIMVMMAVNCWGDATQTIRVIEKDANANVIVWTEHKLDGVIMYSSYPKPATASRVSCPTEQWDDTANKCKVWATRYSYTNFIDCTDTKCKNEYIKTDVGMYGKELIRKKYVADKGDPVLIEKEAVNDKLLTELTNGGLVDAVTTVTTADIKVDTDENGKVDTLLEVKSDGTKTEKELDETTGLVK